MTESNTARFGKRVKSIRTAKKMRMADVATAAKLALSTVSKVENGQMSLTYDKLVKLAKGLGVELTHLLSDNAVDVPVSSPSETAAGLGRRAFSPKGSGNYIKTQWYDYWYLCTDMSAKAMTPILGGTRARSLEDFGPFIRHSGQEFVFVLDGVLDLYSEYYAPSRLERGDSMYFDSSMGHAYISASDEECRFLIVCSDLVTSDPAREEAEGLSLSGN